MPDGPITVDLIYIVSAHYFSTTAIRRFRQLFYYGFATSSYTRNCFPLPRESVSLLVLAKTPCRAVLHRAAAFQCPPGDTRLPPLERTTDQPQQSHYTPLRTQNTSFGRLPNRHFIPNTSNFISIPDRASTITSRHRLKGLFLGCPAQSSQRGRKCKTNSTIMFFLEHSLSIHSAVCRLSIATAH